MYTVYKQLELYANPSAGPKTQRNVNVRILIPQGHILFNSDDRRPGTTYSSKRKKTPCLGERSFRLAESLKFVSRRRATVVRLRERNGGQFERKSARILCLGATRLTLLQHRQCMAAFPNPHLCSSLEDHRFPFAAATASPLPLVTHAHTPANS